MAATIESHPDQALKASDRGVVTLNDLPDEIAGPIRAGSRARGLADCCEAHRIPALLIDRAGQVLHATSCAGEFLSGRLSLQSGHLVGSSEQANAGLQRLLTEALDATSTPRSVFIRSDAGGPDLIVTAINYADSSPYQMLKVVLLLGTNPERLRLAVADVLDHMGNRACVH
jgi:hypothetical protein